MPDGRATGTIRIINMLEHEVFHCRWAPNSSHRESTAQCALCWMNQPSFRLR
jgi:hypothetical protein